MRAKVIYVHGSPLLIEAEGVIMVNANVITGVNKPDGLNGDIVEVQTTVDSMKDICNMISEKVKESGNPLVDGIKQVIDEYKNSKKNSKKPQGSGDDSPQENPQKSDAPQEVGADGATASSQEPKSESYLSESLASTLYESRFSNGPIQDVGLHELQSFLMQYGWTIISN